MMDTDQVYWGLVILLAVLSTMIMMKLDKIERKLDMILKTLPRKGDQHA